VHASAIGKVLLAFSADPAAAVADLGELGPFTDATLTSPDALLADLDLTRRRGWALNDGERFPGVRTMAAPVTDPSGHPWAGLAIQGPSSRLTDERLPALAAALVSAATSMR
jgi:DNA-binding IclR family transcriptional regulator